MMGGEHGRSMTGLAADSPGASERRAKLEPKRKFEISNLRSLERGAVVAKHCPADDDQRHSALLHEAVVEILQGKLRT